MLARELCESYQQFFEAHGHKRIRSASLLPENDPTVLFTTAGMHPLVPFLLGEPHPLGRRLVNVQKCIRTNDIDEVGDTSHLTFFEMLGNWSLGDYFKHESLAWSYEFLTRVLDLNPARLAVTVFAGDADAPRDDVSADIWRSLGIPTERIYFLPKQDNWWGPAGATGPCGPDSEIFYDTGKPDHPNCGPGCPCGKWFEIWNNVFMEYNKTADGRYVKLQQRNVDTGMGVDRTAAVLQGHDDVFTVETLRPLIDHIEQLAGRRYSDNLKPFRVIADHVRAATFAIADGASPSNVEAGYVVRRLDSARCALWSRRGHPAKLLRRLSRMSWWTCSRQRIRSLRRTGSASPMRLSVKKSSSRARSSAACASIQKVTQRTRDKGASALSAADAFDLFETFGFPLPFTVELAREQGLAVDEAGFEALYKEHQEISRRGMEQKFKGGLADHTEETTRLHTATHLLHQALRQVLGPTVRQMGSNITSDRLRFDFSYPDKLTLEQIEQVEAIVNEQIAHDLPVSVEVMPSNQALESGALAFFGEKYGDQVKVYSIGAFSKEVCGGPHVTHTGTLGHFKITKQESVGQGIRRVRAILE